MKLRQMISGFYEENCMMAAFSVSILMLWLDYITGRAVQFPIFYVLPVGMLAWKENIISAYLASLLLPLARLWFHFFWNDSESIYFSVSNSLIYIFALCFYVFLIKKITTMNKSLERKVKVLEGILPICPTCNKIRSESGEYEELEKYISEHSEAVFSHGLCNNCAKEFYPKYFKDKIQFISKFDKNQ